MTCGLRPVRWSTADAIAPAEIRCRPLTRTVIADLAHRHPAPAGVARLATLVGLTR
ncbi:hypothetical protein [Micromonospora sp. C51]|uniref:hypothetical protein n=1 Tax=Micromonospora sp. C51 TaxID=2824879 RepID=UPI001FFCC90E|nr:hypothetical protein [Micromonospora sp. C51]